MRAAGLTRGALYHRFESKRELLAAVYEQVEGELTERMAREAFSGDRAPQSPLEALHRGAELFLDACLEPDVQRIVVLDAPAVLGWERWREVASRFGLGLIEASLSGRDRRRLDPAPAGAAAGPRADGYARRSGADGRSRRRRRAHAGGPGPRLSRR